MCDYHAGHIARATQPVARDRVAAGQPFACNSLPEARARKSSDITVDYPCSETKKALPTIHGKSSQSLAVSSTSRTTTDPIVL